LGDGVVVRAVGVDVVGIDLVDVVVLADLLQVPGVVVAGVFLVPGPVAQVVERPLPGAGDGTGGREQEMPVDDVVVVGVDGAVVVEVAFLPLVAALAGGVGARNTGRRVPKSWRNPVDAPRIIG
jgi:hypothetical protein